MANNNRKGLVERLTVANGRLVQAISAVEFPLSALSWLLFKSAGYRAGVPWWVWRAVLFVHMNLSKDDVTLEDGGGMSSLWLARRCVSVLTVEGDPAWRGEIVRAASREGLSALTVVPSDVSLEADVEGWLVRNIEARIIESWPSVVIIDGPAYREEIFRGVLDLSHPPRMIVFDNSDRIIDSSLLKRAREIGYAAKVFRGFPPGLVHATETTVFLKS